MNSPSGYQAGTWYLICDQCGLKMRSTEMTKRWDGLIVHADPSRGCLESRHPQEFVRSVRDNFPLAVIRPDSEGLEPLHQCTIVTQHPYANFGTAGCMRVGFTAYTAAELMINYICSIQGGFANAGFGTADCATVGRYA